MMKDPALKVGDEKLLIVSVIKDPVYKSMMKDPFHKVKDETP